MNIRIIGVLLVSMLCFIVAASAAAAQPAPFVINGYVSDSGGSPCNDPSVQVTNLNTSASWDAKNDSTSNYYKLVLDSEDVSVGNVLQIEASGCTKTKTIEHTVTQSELEDGGINGFDIVFDASQEIIWQGDVTLINGTRVDVTANSGVSYEINRTTAFGALDAAAEVGIFNYTMNDEWYESWGSLFVDSIADIPNEGYNGWMYWVNYPEDPMPMVGADQFVLDNGDVVTWYWSSSMEMTPANSSMLVEINVAIEEPQGIIWQGDVTLINGTRVDVTANSGVSYEINRTTAFGALDAAAEVGIFNYTMNDEWYESWGSLFVDSIADIPNEGYNGWMYWVNYPEDPMPMVGADQFVLDNGDVVTWYWSSSMEMTPANSSMLVEINVAIEEPQEIIWQGDVTLINGTKVNVTANSGVSYEINRTTALGALDAAAEVGIFNYTMNDEWYESWGSLFVDSIADIPNEGYNGWMYWVNYPEDPMPMVGADQFVLEDGDVVTWYWSSSMEMTPANSSMLVEINVAIEEPQEIIWQGDVTLINGTKVNVTANSGVSYEINRTTALGALDAAAEVGIFNYTMNDEWYESWGSLFVDSIADIPNEGYNGWMYWVNYPEDPMPMVGADQFVLEDGDVVTWYWSSSMEMTPANSSMLVEINVAIEEPQEIIWQGDVTLINGTKVNVTANSGVSYEINRTTALGALDAAAEVGIFNYTMNDEWYESWGSLFVDSIADIPNEGYNGWMYWVNYPEDPMPMVGADQFVLDNGDVVTWYWSSSMEMTPANSSMLVEINVAVTSPEATEDGGDKDDNGGGGGSSSSSSSSGGGASGEDFYNIVLSETDRENIYKNSSVSFSFELEDNIVRHINFTALNSAGTVAAKIEILNNTSTLVSNPPPNVVYKNLNMWMGNYGWATEKNMADITVSFTVEKSWVTDNDIDDTTIALYRYSDDDWDKLVTRKIAEDSNNLYFEAETLGFSSFSVTGMTAEAEASGESMITESTEDAEEVSGEAASEDMSGLPGFGLLTGLSIMLIAVRLLREKK